MTDTEALLKASVRERRRIFLLFTVVLVLVAGALGLGWLGSAIGRDSWHEQAMTWQEQYVELYDEFTATTGEEPAAPDPAIVADASPTAEQGAPGPVGPAGERGARGEPGQNATDAQVAAALANWCTTFGCTGPSGTNGTNGTNGRDGSDSTVPGPAGPAGTPGAPGANGADGRGIRSLYCDDTTGRWTVTYTDGVTADAGTCTTSPLEGELP